jgi:hypothetical protein
MTPEDVAWLRELRFVASRIPKLDAISTFVPIGAESDPVVAEVHARTGFSLRLAIQTLPISRSPTAGRDECDQHDEKQRAEDEYVRASAASGEESSLVTTRRG